MGCNNSKSRSSSTRLWSLRCNSSPAAISVREEPSDASSHRVNGYKVDPGDSSSNGLGNPIAVQMRSYEKACKKIPEIQSFNDALQSRAEQALSAIATDANKNTISLASVGKATDYVFDTEDDAVRRILESNEDICRNPELKALVEDYLESSRTTLRFYSGLKNCVMKARNEQLMSIKLAVRRFEEEEEEGCNNNSSQEGFRKTLEALKLFKELGQPFSEKFFQLFRSVQEQQLQMLDKLTARRRSLGNKLNRIKSWRRVSGIIFASTFTIALVCSVVTAAISAPPSVVALAAAATTAFGPLGSWFRMQWNRYLEPLQNELNLVSDMGERTTAAIAELDTIKRLIDRLTEDVQSIQGTTDISLRYDDAIRIGIKDIRDKVKDFEEWLDCLENRAESYSKNVIEARTAVCKRKISVK